MAELEMDKNPFLIELVIDNIAKCLSFEELKVCRALNHLWKKTTNTIFLKLCPSIRMELYSKEFLASVNHSNQDMTMVQFMEIYSDLNHPHPQAQLLREYRNFSVFGLIEEFIPIFYNFMTEVGPQMTSLELERCEVLRNSQDLMDIVSCRYTPKLEELILKDLKEVGNYQQNDSEMVRIEGKENAHLRRLSISIHKKIQYLDVLLLYPKLKALSFANIPIDVFEEIATGLVTIRKDNGTKLKLIELELSTFFLNRDCEAETKIWYRVEDLIKTANLPLEHISLNGSASEISSALIQHYGENLKSLTLYCDIPQPFPLMKALEKMRVEMCGDLTFLTKVPNLKSLRFDPFLGYSQIYFSKLPPNPLLSLTEFYGGCFKEWNVPEIQKLLLWMPCVQVLEMRLNNTTFAWICQHLPNLKELTVEGFDLDDSGVVGEFEEALRVKGSRPNITNLKALETFKMAGSSASNMGLTEKSVFYGFSLMPKLSNLDIFVKSELSSGAMLALNRGIKNVHVKVVSK